MSRFIQNAGRNPGQVLNGFMSAPLRIRDLSENDLYDFCQIAATTHRVLARKLVDLARKSEIGRNQRSIILLALRDLGAEIKNA